MSTPWEWRIDDIERRANEARGRLHEIDSLRSYVDRLERSLLEARSETDRLRSRWHELEARLVNVEQALEVRP